MELDHQLRGQLVAFIDLETTGTDKRARIIEVGIVLVDLMTTDPVVFLSQLVDPQCRIPRDATRVHGLHNSDVKGHPTWPQVWPKVRALFEEGAIPCAYNAVFDERMIRQDNERCNLAGSLPPRSLWLDPFPLVRRMDPKRHRLTDACQRRGITPGTHRATSDAVATAHLLRKMIGEAYRRPDLRPQPPHHPTLRTWLRWQNGKALPSVQPTLPGVVDDKRYLVAPPSSAARSRDAWSKIRGAPRTREGHPVCVPCANLHPRPRFLSYTPEHFGTLAHSCPCVYCGASSAGHRWGPTKPKPVLLDFSNRPRKHDPPVQPAGGASLAHLARAAPSSAVDA